MLHCFAFSSLKIIFKIREKKLSRFRIFRKNLEDCRIRKKISLNFSFFRESFFSLETLNCDLTRVKNVLAPDTRIKSAISFPNCRCRFYNQITINGKTRLSSELFRNFQDFSTPNYSKLHEQH